VNVNQGLSVHIGTARFMHLKKNNEGIADIGSKFIIKEE
jgi:hypothetical protein